MICTHESLGIAKCLPLELLLQIIVAMISAPWESGEPWGSYLLKSGGGGKMVFADAEGHIVGEINNKGTWLALCEQFHSFLLIPKGRLYNGIAGLVLVALAVSGLY